MLDIFMENLKIEHDKQNDKENNIDKNDIKLLLVYTVCFYDRSSI